MNYGAGYLFLSWVNYGAGYLFLSCELRGRLPISLEWVNYGADYLFLSCCRPDTIGPPLIPNYPQLPVRPRCPQWQRPSRLRQILRYQGDCALLRIGLLPFRDRSHSGPEYRPELFGSLLEPAEPAFPIWPVSRAEILQVIHNSTVLAFWKRLPLDGAESGLRSGHRGVAHAEQLGRLANRRTKHGR